MTLEQEIYLQLLELYAQELETENIGLENLVLAYQTIKHMKPLPNPSPWPQEPYTVWCSTTGEYELGSLEDAEKFAQSRNYQYETK